MVVEGHQIITTADGLADQTLIRLKKQGDGLFSLGRVVWIDYQANLAAMTTDEKDFWTGLQPAQLADPVPITGSGAHPALARRFARKSPGRNRADDGGKFRLELRLRARA